MKQIKLGPLDAIIVDNKDSSAEVDLTVVLLHGFGASGTDLVPLARVLGQGVKAQFVFLAAPIKLPPMYGDGRAWWPLDIERLMEARARGDSGLTKEVPAGLPEARQSLEAALDALAVSRSKIVIGGFSQGSMLALDVAIRSADSFRGVIAMSSTLICADEWKAQVGNLSSVPMVLSHGRVDEILPFDNAIALRQLLTDAGAKVEWVDFVGGHEIPPPVVEAAAKLIRSASVARD